MNRSLIIFLWIYSFVGIQALKGQRNIIYQNAFTDKNNSTQNINSHLDDVRGQVGKFNNGDVLSTIPNNNNDTAISVTFWVKPDNIELHPGTMLGEDSLFFFRYLSNRELQFNHYLKKDINTQGVLCNNQWQHLAFTLSSQGKLKIYYEGDCILTDSIDTQWHNFNRRNFSIGTDRYGVNPEGLIDDLVICNTVLSPKEIKAYYLKSRITPPLSKDLKVYLPLQTNFNNKANNTSLSILAEQVEFNTDKIKGDVALYKNDSSIINLNGFNYDHQITIATWVRASNNKWLMSLAGNKDLSFRFTTNNNALWFSVPMLFTNKSQHYKSAPRDWMHAAIAIKFNHEVDFYINGILVDSQPINGKTGQSGSLTLGRSMWGDNFNGSMTQFALWSRALNLNEIQQVYNGKLETISWKKEQQFDKNNILVVAGVILILVLIGFILVIKYRKTKKETDYNVPAQELIVNAIHITGIFKAYDQNGADISNLFSPTLIRLLSLIVLFPILKNRRITSIEISDILWENDSTSQQKNNRSTNIHRLRKIFEHFNNAELIYKNKEWYVESTSDFKIDIAVIDKNLRIGSLTYIPSSIQLCKPLRAESFDGIIQEFEEKYFGIFQELCSSYYQSKTYEKVVVLAKLWIEIAPLNDMPITYLISSLMQYQRKQEALNYYTLFKAQHKKILNEETSLKFEDCSSL